MRTYNNSAISLEGVGKKYTVYFEKPALVRSLFPFISKGPGRSEFWALRDITLDVKRGECVGVIGPNGSGKSTILSLLAGVTAESRGSLTVNGKVSALLSLGAGFHPELTGRENIYLNAAILGMKKTQVDELFGGIISYADIGEFIEAKMSAYSAGMHMRLGFAIAATVPFDILLIDEVLAVGDMAFQQKCFKTMMGLIQDENRTVVFVSHDLGRIEEMCHRAVWLENGRVEEMDSAEVVVRRYRQKYRNRYEQLDIKIKRKPRECAAGIAVDASRTLRRVPAGLFGANIDWAIEGPLTWDSGERRVNPFMARLLSSYRFNVMRYPGGQSADYFHWAEAIGDKRKPQVEGHARQKTYPVFGPAEFLTLCREINAAPLVTLNIGSGTTEEALDWIRYMKTNGCDPPYVELGHELYYDDYHNLGLEFPLGPEEYARRSVAVAERLREIAPDARLLFSGCNDTGVFPRYRHPEWNEIIFKNCGRHIDFLSIHNATVPIMNITADYRYPELEDTARALLAAALYTDDNLSRVSRGMDSSLRGKVKIAVTDYSVMFTDIPQVVHGKHRMKDLPDASAEWERNTYWVSALCEAALLNTFIRRDEVEIACRFSLLSGIYSALYRYVEGQWIPAPQALVYELYNRLSGHFLVDSSVTSETFDSPAVGIIPAQKAVPYVDCCSVKSEDGTKLIVSLINRNLESAIRATIDVAGFSAREVAVKMIAPRQFYSRNTVQNPTNVELRERTIPVERLPGSDSGKIVIDLPRHSLCFLVLNGNEWL